MIALLTAAAAVLGVVFVVVPLVSLLAPWISRWLMAYGEWLVRLEALGERLRRGGGS